MSPAENLLLNDAEKRKPKEQIVEELYGSFMHK